MTDLDAPGYFTMSMATLFAAPAFMGGRLERWMRQAFLANGVLGPFILLAQVVPSMMYVGALWLVTFNLSATLATLIFHKYMTAQKQ